MIGDFKRAYEFTEEREGGLSKDPLDRGGETKYGISTGTFESQKEKGTIDRSMKNVNGLSKGQAEKILREQYWDKIWGDALPWDISIALFDTAVNFHPKTAIQMLQKILKVKQDGRMGPDTLEAVRNYKGDLVEEFLKARLQAHEDDAKKNKEQQGHIRGWRYRVARLRHYLRPEVPAQQAPTGKNPYAPPAAKNPPYSDETPSASSPLSAFSYLDLTRRPNALGPIPPMWDPGAVSTGENSATPGAYLGPVGRPNALGPISRNLGPRCIAHRPEFRYAQRIQRSSRTSQCPGSHSPNVGPRRTADRPQSAGRRSTDESASCMGQSALSVFPERCARALFPCTACLCFYGLSYLAPAVRLTSFSTQKPPRTCRVGEPLGTASIGQGWQPCPFPSQRLRPPAGHPSRRVPGSPSERIPQRLRPLAGL